MMTEPEKTIMRAASNIAREDALSLAANATTADERDAVNAGLLAHLTDVGLEPAERVTLETARWSR